MEGSFDFDNAVFTYAISTKPIERFSQHTTIAKGALTVSHTSKTRVITCEEGNCEITIIGYCIDAQGEIPRMDIPNFFLSKHFEDIVAAYRAFDRFAGKYVVFFHSGSAHAIWGDATCSIEINYGINDTDFCIASTDKLAADILGSPISEYSTKIRKGSSSYSQPLPNDLTMYDEIKTLLPNHYFDCVRRQAVRVPLGVEQTSSPNEIFEILQRTAHLAQTISKTYCNDYPLICSLTAGTDSRVVFSFLKNLDPALMGFTYRHAFTDQSAELAIPRQICNITQHPYKVADDLKAPKGFLDSLCQGFGPYWDTSTANSAYTFLSNFMGKAEVDGSIIDEVGKSTQEHAVPNCLLNISFFMCKLHNYEPSTRKELKRYIQGIIDTGEQRHIADLFAIEQKLGRRVGQGIALYSICGINLFNIFNCREILLQWTRIPRKIRSTKLVPKEFLKITDPSMLAFPFNPEDKLISFIKKSWLSFYLATYVKYFFPKFFGSY